MNKEEFFEFLDERKNKTLSEVERLSKEDRKDESNTLKAKANIYDIYKAIWSAVEQMTKDETCFKEEFLKKVEVITSPWAKSLEVAKQHDHVAKIVIEEAKLSAVAEIKEKLSTL